MLKIASSGKNMKEESKGLVVRHGWCETECSQMFCTKSQGQKCKAWLWETKWTAGLQWSLSVVWKYRCILYLLGACKVSSFWTCNHNISTLMYIKLYNCIIYFLINLLGMYRYLSCQTRELQLERGFFIKLLWAWFLLRDGKNAYELLCE